MMIYVKHLKTNELRSYDMDLAPVQVRKAMDEYLPEHSMMKVMKRKGKHAVLYEYFEAVEVVGMKTCGVLINMQ